MTYNTCFIYMGYKYVKKMDFFSPDTITSLLLITPLASARYIFEIFLISFGSVCLYLSISQILNDLSVIIHPENYRNG